VRAAEPADHDAMAELFLAAGRAAWGFAGEAALAGMRAPAFTGGELVAEAGGEVVGFVVPVGCEIDLLYTHPRAWGSGAGRALLAAGETALRDNGCTEATLWTEERNERPRRFYEAAGWRTDGGVRKRVWNGAKLRELRYCKRL
jgi:GNAT superfamily N-acetyltransferase